MTSALCLCRFQQPQALRSFPLRYLSNAYDRVTVSFSGGYFQMVFPRRIFFVSGSTSFNSTTKKILPTGMRSTARQDFSFFAFRFSFLPKDHRLRRTLRVAPADFSAFALGAFGALAAFSGLTFEALSSESDFLTEAPRRALFFYLPVATPCAVVSGRNHSPSLKACSCDSIFCCSFAIESGVGQ